MHRRDKEKHRPNHQLGMSSPTVADLERLYHLRHEAFRRTLAAVAGSREAGDDALQEGFARALASLRQFRGEGTLEAWTWRICLNEAKGGHRRRRTEPLDEGIPAPADEPVHDAELRAAPRELPERRRQVVFLRHFADLSYDDIAAATGMRPGTVAATLSKAYTQLERRLGAKEVVR